MRRDGSKVAVITGAASGLGRAIALALGREVWTVVIADIDLEGAEETARAIRSAGGDAEVTHLDVRDAQAFEALAETVWDTHARCDLLVNNAGVASTGQIGEASLDDWRWCIDIDLYGPIHGCHAFAPRMKAQGWGHVVNVASIAAYALGARMGPYNVAKAGVVALSETLRAELLDHNVGVTVVCPGFFATNIAANMRVTHDREREKTDALIHSADLSAEQVAQRVLDAVRKNAPFVVTPRSAQVLFWLRRLLPARATEVMRQLLFKPPRE